MPILRALTALALLAIASQLDVDFNIRDVREATNALLRMFGTDGTLRQSGTTVASLI
ncbi:hypothetical protein [Tunturiibacter lichenicola]|uniref:hypothetical protein n=1 Tax=Tunturiibacter lichenicola TaxID=2051959 RepID=UPI0021B35E61|nr:hypothetical protein [Edaphobacter lichenicola]